MNFQLFDAKLETSSFDITNIDNIRGTQI